MSVIDCFANASGVAAPANVDSPHSPREIMRALIAADFAVRSFAAIALDLDSPLGVQSGGAAALRALTPIVDGSTAAESIAALRRLAYKNDETKTAFDVVHAAGSAWNMYYECGEFFTGTIAGAVAGAGAGAGRLARTISTWTQGKSAARGDINRCLEAMMGV